MDLTVKIAEVLLDAGCDPTCVTDDGRTALMYAIENVRLNLYHLSFLLPQLHTILASAVV